MRAFRRNKKEQRWEDEHILKLEQLLHQGYTVEQTAHELTELYGIVRSKCSVKKKKQKLGIQSCWQRPLQPSLPLEILPIQKVEILNDGSIIKKEKKKSRGKPYSEKTPEEKEKLKELAAKRLSTEENYMKSRYHGIKHRDKFNDARKRSEYKNNHVYECSVTWEQFWDLWLSHKEKHGGMNCAISGKPMTHIGLSLKKEKDKKFKRNWDNISVDRLDSTKGYTFQNIIFIRWIINKQKNDLEIKHMRKILELYEERFIKLKNII